MGVINDINLSQCLKAKKKKKDWKRLEFQGQIKIWIEQGNLSGNIRKERIGMVTSRRDPLVSEGLMSLMLTPGYILDFSTPGSSESLGEGWLFWSSLQVTTTTTAFPPSWITPSAFT